MVLTAPVGIVQMDDASQRLGVIALDHGMHQLVPGGLPLVVLDQPGGVGVDAQLPAQAQGRDAVLVPWGLPLVVLGQQVDRQEPDAQRQVGAREQGAGGQRGLMLAAVALEHRATAQLAVAGMPAVRAAEPARPTHAHQGVAALGLAAVAFEEGRQAHAGLRRFSTAAGGSTGWHSWTWCNPRWIRWLHATTRAYQRLRQVGNQDKLTECARLASRSDCLVYRRIGSDHFDVPAAADCM